jgi:hypothetical protein
MKGPAGMKRVNHNLIEASLKAVLYLGLLILTPLFSLTFLALFAGGERFVLNPYGFVMWTILSFLLWVGLGWQVAKQHGWQGLILYLVAVGFYLMVLTSAGLSGL